jgi:hypothetical protein
VASGNIEIGTKTASHKPAQMASAMSQQGVHVMGDNECAQQKLVRLVGCRDPQARVEKAHGERARPDTRKGQFDRPKKQF